MRHFLLLLVLLLKFGIIGFTQTDSIAPVTWTFTTSKVEAGKVSISMKAVIKEGWKLFSTTASDDEPNTRVIIDTTTPSKVISIDEEGNLKPEKEPLLDNLLVKFFQGEAIFRVILDV